MNELLRKKLIDYQEVKGARGYRESKVIIEERMEYMMNKNLLSVTLPSTVTYEQVSLFLQRNTLYEHYDCHGHASGHVEISLKTSVPPGDE